MPLKNNYADAIFTGNRKYTLTNNPDNTVSLTDVTTYTQVGDTVAAADINAITGAINNQLAGFTLWEGTQAQYNQLTPDASTIYFIEEA